MKRRDELKKIFEDVGESRTVIEPLIEDVVFLEEHLSDLRMLPFIRVNPNNPSEQKTTPAAKQYKEFLQQYNNCIKILCSVLRKDAAEEDSPLRAFMKGFNDD